MENRSTQVANDILVVRSIRNAERILSQLKDLDDETADLIGSIRTGFIAQAITGAILSITSVKVLLIEQQEINNANR
tara:strand:- start:5211 stop:5441 length:231 start_codon:yes stop_codon:yes gene_type:complete